MRTAWTRLIRFQATDGRLLYGEPILPDGKFDIGDTDERTGLQAKVIQGDDLYDESGTTKVTDEIVTVKELLGPLTSATVPIIRAIGLNYLAHIRETGKAAPRYPTMFMKASTAVHDHGKDIIIPKIAQDEQADYEGELCIVIGKDAKDIAEEDALDYVAGFTVGNDVSSRKLQSKPELAGPLPQACFSKGFDTYAPLGPAIVSTSLIPDPSKLLLETRVNGELRQTGELRDIAFSVPYLIHYLSSGTTLQKGSIIMTGTPGGVGCHLNPPQFLVPGTNVHVHVSEIGTLKNGVAHAL